jgi:hypothetical protein
LYESWTHSIYVAAQLTADRPSIVRREPPMTVLLHLTLSIHSRAICLGSPDGTTTRARPLRPCPVTSGMLTPQCNLCDQSKQKVRNRIWHRALVRRNPMDVRTSSYHLYTKSYQSTTTIIRHSALVDLEQCTAVPNLMLGKATSGFSRGSLA